MTIARRGLTLLEVLVASAILAMLAGAVVPLLSSSVRAMSHLDESSDRQRLRFDLGRLADGFMKDPAAFGCKDLPMAIGHGNLSLDWPKNFTDGGFAAVTAHALPADKDKQDHAWLLFTCDDQSAM